MKRTLSLFLTVVLAAALLVCPAAADTSASAPWVGVDGGVATVHGLSESWNGIQLTLKLNKAAVEDLFEVDSALPDGHYYTHTVSGDTLTIYITSRRELNEGDTLLLGKLKAEAGFTIEGVSNLRMAKVGADSKDTKSITYETVGTTEPGPDEPGPGPGPGPDDPGPDDPGPDDPGPVNPGTTGSVRSYAVKAEVNDGGNLKLSTTQAPKGETVTVTATPNAGYELQSLTVINSAGKAVDVSDLGDGKWSFTMPASAVTVTARFAVKQPEALPFTDVGENDWFREAVDYVYEKGLMNGTSQSLFSPQNTTTRGMVVTILHRYEGSPETESAHFQDVAPGQYYAGAVSWAAANGVVTGISDTQFAPDREITREQMAVILYRYAKYKGLNVSGRADLSGFADANQISSYAVDAMAWANDAGLINGVGNNALQPGGSATRAQVAAILMRFCKNIVEQASA